MVLRDNNYRDPICCEDNVTPVQKLELWNFSENYLIELFSLLGINYLLCDN